MGVGENEINTQNPNKLLEMGDARKGLGLEEQGRDNLQASSPGRNPWEAGNKSSIQEKAWRPPALEPAGSCPSSAHSRTQGMPLGTAGSSHSLGCFLDFEEPLDDFLGFFIRWYFRASSLSGAAASPGGDGRFLGRKSRHVPSAAPGHTWASGRPQWGIGRSQPALPWKRKR